MADSFEATDVSPTTDYRYSYAPREFKTISVGDTVTKVRKKVAPFRFKLAARNISREIELEGGEQVLELGSGLGLLGKAIKEEVGGDIKYFGVELAYNPAKKK